MSGFTDKSLQIEGREWGWFAERCRHFAEPGVKPHYGPDCSFLVDHIAMKLRISPVEGWVEGEARVRV